MASRCLLVQVIACASTEAARRDYLAADPRADLVELRLDGIRDLDFDRLIGARGKPKLVTVRSRQQGGSAPASDREALLRRAVNARVEYVDLEPGDQDHAFLRRAGPTRRILSFHHLDATPADLPSLYTHLRSIGRGALIKIVPFAEVASDVLRIRELLRFADPGGLIAMCAGEKGIASRILAAHWGSAAVFAPRRGAAPSAPGQLPLEDLVDTYRFDTVTHETRLLGIVGHPIGHSLSPRVHNAALAACGVNARYLAFDAATLAEFLPLLSELRIHGLSVTLPHKERILAYVDRVDPVARRAGAANTVVKTWNRLEGFNTDVEAAIAPLHGRIDLKGARVAVMGAGGAARAVLLGLGRRGARVTLFARRRERARELAGLFEAAHLPWPRLKGFRCDLLVNATSVGMSPRTEETPIPASWVAAPLIYDVIYSPPETRFLAEARRRGLQVVGGLEMFLGQAAEQFRLFTGKEPPLEVMRAAALDGLRARAEEDKDARKTPRRRARRGRRR